MAGRMDSAEVYLPPIGDIKELIRNVDESSTSNQACLITNLTAMCFHLSKDQDTLMVLKRSGAGLPSLAAIPTMKEVLSDSGLLKGLISLLTPSSAHPIKQSSDGGPPSYEPKPGGGRKRSPSDADTSDPTPLKKNSNLLPPTPSLGTKQNARLTVQKGQISEKNISVLAASVLFTVFQHVECWPAELLRAFAEDAFGPRYWVSEEKCKAFAANFEVSLKTQEFGDALMSSLAEQAEAHYASLFQPSGSKHPSAVSKRKESKDDESSDASSSGDEEVLESDNVQSSSNGQHKGGGTGLEALFDMKTSRRVRSRYTPGRIIHDDTIADALQSRLDLKSKQNYRLLETLPLFLSIRRVRSLSSSYLERWLNSPALAGLGRTLLAKLIGAMECADPPIEEDVSVLQNVLALRLKANQLSMQIDQTSSIVRKMRSQAVAEMIFTHCLRGECSAGSVSNALKSSDDHLRMLRSAYAALGDSRLAAKALALSINGIASNFFESSDGDVHSHFGDIIRLVSVVVKSLGKLFNGFYFVESFIHISSGPATAKKKASIKTSARLIFEFTLLLVGDSDKSEEELAHFRQDMLRLRKQILIWCLESLCPAYFSKISREEQVSRQGACYKRGNVTEGPGAPDWQSALVESSDQHTDSPSTQKLFTIMRCMLFAATSSSPQMSTFAAKVNEEDIDDYRCKAIDCLCRDGVDVDDEMLFVVTKASSLTPSSKIAIIENLLVSCGTRRGGRIVSCRPGTVKELFLATEYRPVFKRDADSTYDSREFPKLAIASLWWRVTAIALVLSGSVPEVGKDLWNSQPNIRSLIKMTTSQKYRFPTADCTKKERESAKHEDQRLKEEEREIVRFLFAPPQQKKKASKPEGSTALQSPLHRRGLRSSARQRAKKERIYAMEQLRKEEEERQERLAIAKSLKSLSRNVQIYDLSQPARKPPKTFVEELLLPAVVAFGLPLQFQQCSEPDFLMKTIGEGRGAVERSYDWLIPVISSHPEIIDRLGSLTTCFLVLRAYGDEGSSDLLRLASPLLENLKTQLTCGHEQSLQTLELLLVDLSGEQRSRRICSHRVLQEIVGSADDWLDKVVALNGSPEILPLVVHYVRHALAFESGLVLGNYLSALSRLMKKMNDSSSAFVLTLCRVISARPQECISVLDKNATLKKLALSNVEQVFDDAKSSSHGARDSVSITIRSSDVVISYSVLHTAIILLSCWDDNAETEHAVRSIVHHFLVPFQDDGERSVCGLSSVKPESAISAKHWVLLAQSRSDTVAMQAALLAPHAHLARLLCVSNKSQIKVILDRIEPDPDRWDNMFSDSSWPDCASLSSMQAKRRVLGLIRVHERNCDIPKKHRAFVSWLEKCEQTDQTLSRNLLNDIQLEDRQDDNAVEDLMVDDTTMNSILDDADDGGDVWNCEPVGQKPDKPIAPGAISKQFIQSCLESGNFPVLEMSLHLACQDPQSSKSHVDAAAYILDMHTQYNNDSFASCLLKVAELTQCAGGNNLWKRMFSPQGQSMPLQMSLVQRCALSWSDSHVASCVDWIILSKQSWNGVKQLKLVLRFLAVVSEERSSLCFNFIKSAQEICYTQDQAVVITSLALSLAVLESSGGGSNARNLLPDWLILILIIAKTHLPAVIEAVLVTDPRECPVIAEVVLRLYLAYPDDMKFSAGPNLQILLLQASGNNQSWRRNGPRCHLDSLICEVFSNLSHQQHIQAANDLAKKHPLLIARHMSILEHGLEQDASGRDEDGLLLLKRGRVGGNILQAMPAVVGDRNISVTIVRWGYTFNESVWCTTLDVMLALPNEILFGLCDHVSLVKVLDLCLKLLMVQIVELNAENVVTEIREKYRRLIKTFHEYKRDAYNSWISRDLSGWGGIETLLHSVSCKLSYN